MAEEKLVKPVRQIFAEQLRNGQSVRMNIKGDCMQPFIRKSDIAIVKPIKFDETKIGDIIVYARSSDDSFTMHRLIRKRRDINGREYLFTKGDASMYGDYPVYPEDFYGKAVSIERKQGRKINLETKFNRIFSYLMAYYSYISALFREVIVHPFQFLKRIWKKRPWIKKIL